MPLINALRNKHVEEDIYILGSGPSLRIFPAKFFYGRTTIGLNQAWKTINTTYNLTVHPDEIIPRDYIKRKQIWITKRKKHFTPRLHSNNNIYWFISNGSNVKDFSFAGQSCADGRRLYVGRGVQTAALILAARMGARAAFLCGCDFGPIGSDHHATWQSVRFHGMPPDGVYREYYLNTRIVKEIVEKEFGMVIINCNPFLGLHHWKEDYEHQINKKGLENFPSPVDDSRYIRNQLDFT